MKIVVVSASTRNNSESLRISNWIREEAEEFDHSVELLDLNKEKISLNMDEVWDSNSDTAKAWSKTSKLLLDADAFVFVSPEWNGMASPALRVMLNYTSGELSHKPAMLVGVSSGFGGRYPLAELRMSSAKNTRVVYVPDQVVVMECKDKLLSHLPQKTESTDGRLQDRIRYSIKMLIEYAKALKPIREGGVVDLITYENGV